MQRTLKLGALAHDDAGKTPLTEQILFRADVISGSGGVGQSITQPYTLELECRRGIAVVRHRLLFGVMT
jgi:ribosomal protection tetracycline resistance protein